MAEMVTLEGDQCERCRVLLCFILNNADLLASWQVEGCSF